MAIHAAPPEQKPGHGLRCVRHGAIDPVAAEWDRFVPRDLPHLRAGFLRAVERGGMVHDPAYLMVYHDDRLAAVAVTYTLFLDTSLAAPAWLRRCVSAVRKVMPRFWWKPMRICGS